MTDHRGVSGYPPFGFLRCRRSDQSYQAVLIVGQTNYLSSIRSIQP